MNQLNSPLKNILYGIALGISLIAPGFSAATMAIILGIYEALINLVNDIFSKNIKQTLKAVATLIIGVGIAIFVFSHVLGIAMESFPYETRFFFLGLILATIPLIIKQGDMEANIDKKVTIAFILSFIVSASFVFIGELGLLDGDLGNISTLIILAAAGVLAASSMILPGLSGSLVLLILGVYEFVLESVRTLNIPVVLSIFIGALLGLVVCARGMKNLLKASPTILYAISLGLVVGSIPVVLADGIPAFGSTLLSGIATLIIGYLLVAQMNKIQRK